MNRVLLKHLLAAAGALALLIPGSMVMATDMEVRGAVNGEGILNTDERATVVDARVDFEVDVGPFTFGGVYRAYDFGDRDYNPARIEPQYDLKHRYLEVHRNALLVRAGHYFSTFGKGLTLRSFEDIDLEHDTAIDGFIAEYDVGLVTITGLAGKVQEDISNLEYREHRLRGGRIKAGLADWITVAASGLDRNTELHKEGLDLAGSVSRSDDDVLGTEVQVWLGPLAFSGEYAWREGGYYPLAEEGYLEGHGAYVAANVSAGGLTLLGEYKDYEYFENALASPPICVKEHVWTLMNRATHQVDFGNERGFLVEGMLGVPGDLLITAGASESRTQGASLAHWEIFSQIDRMVPLWGVRSIAASWSRDYDLESSIEGSFTEYMSGAVDFAFDLGSGWMIEANLEAQRTEDYSYSSYFRDPVHEDLLGSVTVYPRPGMTVAVRGEAATMEGAERDTWTFADIRVEVADDLEVSLGAGSERGGKKCSGGICYTEPEFAGLRIRLSTFF